MYKIPYFTKTSIVQNETCEGETIEQKMVRIITTKEPIKDGAPEIYTERKDGVLPGFNVRTDRWEVAIDGISYSQKAAAAKRENKAKMAVVKEDDTTKKDGGAEPIQATE